MNSKSKEFNKKYSKKEEFDTLDEWGLDDGLSKKKKSMKKNNKKRSLKRAKGDDKNFNKYMTKVSPDDANQKNELIEGDDDNYKTPVDTGYKKKSKAKSKTKSKSKNKVKEDSSVSSLSIEDGGLFANKEPIKNKKNDMSKFLKNIGTDQLIPVIGEVQNMMDINQYQNNQVYSSDNGEAKILDKGIYNLINSGKLPMPYINSTMNMTQQSNPYMNQNDQMMQPQMMQPQMMQPQMMQQQMMQPNMMESQMMQPNIMESQMMQPQMMQAPMLNSLGPQLMSGMEEGLNKLPMPTVDLNKDNLLSDNNHQSLNTNINELVGGSTNDFFLKKKI
jgi:hypothetical protein